MNDLKRRWRNKGLRRRLIAGMVLVGFVGFTLLQSFLPGPKLRVTERKAQTVAGAEKVDKLYGNGDTLEKRSANPVILPTPIIPSSEVVVDRADGLPEQQPDLSPLPDAKKQALADLADQPDAPAVITEDELEQAVLEIAARNGADAADVVVAVPGYRGHPRGGPLFTERTQTPPNATETPTKDRAVPVVPERKNASVSGWTEVEEPTGFRLGQGLPARLLSDVVVGQGNTEAVVQVTDPATGRPLGLTVVKVTQPDAEAARIGLSGSLIVTADGGNIQGSFAAYGPDGGLGLVARRKRHRARHIGLNLYRTALGILPLRLAASSDSITAGFGAEAGSAIIQQLADDASVGAPQTVYLSRGTHFRLVFEGPAESAGRASVNAQALPFPGTASANRQSALLRGYLKHLTRDGAAAPDLEGYLKNPQALEALQ